MSCFQALRYRAETPKQLSFSDRRDDFAGAKAEYILNYTSNVIKITHDGRRYFFKEAKKRPASLRACVYEGVDTFFEEITEDPALKERVLVSLKQESNLKKLARMGSKERPGDRLHRYLVSGDETILGLPRHTSSAEEKELRKLVFYLYGELQNWFYNTGVKAGELQTFSAVRALGTYALARLLGVEELIPRCDFVKICLNGKTKYGVLSEEAPGDTWISRPPKERASLVTPAILRGLTNLNLLDVLAGENDHRVGNYHVVTEASAGESPILSFDNDSPDVFGFSANVRFSNLTGCSLFIDKKGLINRAHLDEKAAKALLAMKKERLQALQPYFGRLQLWFLWRRIGKVQKALTKTLSVRRDLLLWEGEWSAEHLRKDLSPKYGKTYLASLLTDCYFEKGFHDYDRL